MTSPDEQEDLRQLATEMQKDPLGFDPATFRKATITAVNLASTPPVVTILLSGDTTTSIPDVRVFRSYVPVVNDTALILRQGKEMLALGKVAPSTYTEGYVRYSRSGGQSVNHNTITKVALSSGDVTDSGIVVMSNDRDFSLQKTGVYSITSTTPWASASAGARWAWIGLDTDSSVRYAVSVLNPNNSSYVSHNLSVTRRFTANTAVSLYAYQDSGATQTLFPGSGLAPLDLNIAYLGP